MIAQHVLVPEHDAAKQFVSEYANADHGWLMTIGFGAWTISLAATAWLARAARSLATAFAVAAAGMAVTAAFATTTVAGELPAGTEQSTEGRLHDLGSGLVLVALTAAAVSSAWVFRSRRRFAVAVAAGLTLVFAAAVALLAVGPEVGGIRQRALLVAACVWQAALIARLGSPAQE